VSLNSCRILVEKPEEKTPPGRLTHSLVDNIKIDLGELLWGGMD
jgi:hypothetical protein